MKKIDVSGSLDELVALVREAGGLTRTVLLLKDGRAYAALTPVVPDRVEAIDDETLSVGLSPAFHAIIEEGRRQHAAGLRFSQEEMERLVGSGKDTRIPIMHTEGERACGQLAFTLVRRPHAIDPIQAADFELPDGRQPVAGEDVRCGTCGARLGGDIFAAITKASVAASGGFAMGVGA